MTFDEFFQEATKTPPYPYQRRLATTPGLAELVRAPTGAGKTAAVVLGWLWRRHFAEPDVRRTTPRRLVYCLPMRVLVEQSAGEAKKWLDNLGLDIKVEILMGGSEVGDWYLHPERSAVLIGTQDMLLSRALNRGYAASRFHWPVDFGLLNNDCLWVFDEPQLMGNGVATSSQLAGLRSALGTFGACPSLWMSATLEPAWLDTVDFAGRRGGPTLELDDEDYASHPLRERMTAEKSLERFGASATTDGKDVARQVVKHHTEGTQTLIVLNTVDRAKAVYHAVKKEKAAPKDVLLIHSRFRLREREELNRLMMQPAEDRIIVATQVVEAGVDLSVRTLVTELAPWSSLVQRIGRCNRTGHDGPGRVFWVELDADKQGPPYEADDLRFAREQLAELEGKDVSPKALENFKRERSIRLDFAPSHVLRRRDLLDLFDTAPDLSGNDIDVARFVRGDKEDSDVQVFWREVGPDGPGESQSDPGRRELCRVRVGDAREFLKKERKGRKPRGYLWDHLDGEWREVRDAKREVYPGVTILLPSHSGGYSTEFGWDDDSPEHVEPILVGSDGPPDSTPDDPDSSGPGPELTVAEHTQHVCDEVDAILEGLGGLPEGWPGHLVRAARWHDAGKAHWAFQQGIRAANPTLDPGTLWAKSGTDARMRHGRRYFRHELASALAALQHALPFEVAYLIAAHHGKVRLSIRALPDEDQEGVLLALGVRDGDTLPDVDLGGETCAALNLDLTPMLLGGEASWTARALALRDAIGPFRLAYLESLLVSADRRASKAEREGGRA